ncbi:MAG: TonB family protein [Gemmatimonadaceae bacterium]
MRRLLILACLAVPSRLLFPQAVDGRGTIAGVVRDSAGAALAGAQISVAGTDIRAESDERGAFRLAAVRSGLASVRVRRLGFLPETVEVSVEPARTAEVTILLEQVAQVLATVVVRREPGARRYTGRLARFYERRDLGIGHFITREEIDRRAPMRLTDLFRTIPGVHVVNDRFGRARVRMRAAGCAPLVWIDGAPATAGEFDVDVFLPESLEGIEVYSGPATIPSELMWIQGAGRCGVIAVWSRLDPPARRRRAGDRTVAAELAALVDSLKVYTADQVDTPARPDTAALAQPAYPDSLHTVGIAGSVVAEFVVDTTGQVELDTFNAVSSTHPRFAEAVRRAVATAKFTPALLDGRRVRQLVQLPFRFDVRD